MQFSSEIKEELSNKFKDTGIELDDNEIHGALAEAYRQFDASRQSGPPSSTPLPVHVWLAVEVMRPVMAEIFETDGPTEDGHTVQ